MYVPDVIRFVMQVNQAAHLRWWRRQTKKKNNNNHQNEQQKQQSNGPCYEQTIGFSGNCKKNEIQQLRYPWEVISKIGILGVIIIEAERWARARSLQATTTQNEIKRKQHQQ